MTIDTVLHNGRIYTMRTEGEFVEAVAISGQRIVLMGSNAMVLRRAGKRCRRIDLSCRTAIPGVVDCHTHLLSFGLGMERLSLEDCRDIDEVIRKVSECVKNSEKGAWIRGRGWNRNLFSVGSRPDKYKLDAVSPDNPVALRSQDGHVMWLNSQALAKARITKATPSPIGGEVEKDTRTGEPTGILRENAISLVEASLDKPTPEEAQAAMKRAIAECLKRGITGVHNYEDALAFKTFQVLAERNELKLRVVAYLDEKRLDDLIRTGLRSGFGDHNLRFGGIKFFADGTLSSRTALMFEEFNDDPGNFGIAVTPRDKLQELVREANMAGIAVAIHAIGDRGNRNAIDAIEYAGPAARRLALPNRIEHAQLLAGDDFLRLGILGIVASMQPCHIMMNIITAMKAWGERTKQAYAIGTLVKNGVKVVFGSDVPVMDNNPMNSIYSACYRQRADGYPEGGWHMENAISRFTALKSFTVIPAEIMNEEKVRGTIEPGKLADIVVLSGNVFECEPSEILEIEPEMTILGGEIVWQKEGFPEGKGKREHELHE